eukprot:3196714-Amphidinium_carterae.1
MGTLKFGTDSSRHQNAPRHILHVTTYAARNFKKRGLLVHSKRVTAALNSKLLPRMGGVHI